MRLAFSGRQTGMNEVQKYKVRELFTMWWLTEIESFHHGCCTGADEDFHWLVREAWGNHGSYIVGHPSNIDSKTSHDVLDDCNSIWLAPKPPLQRNLDMSLRGDRLLATPNSEEMTMRSGTWSTVRYFYNAKKPIVLVLPSGRVKFNNQDLWS